MKENVKLLKLDTADVQISMGIQKERWDYCRCFTSEHLEIAKKMREVFDIDQKWWNV